MSSNPKPSGKPLKIQRLKERAFRMLMESILLNPNLGAGIDATGVSGGGKSNFAEWAAIQSLQLGVPFIYFDPHSDSAQKVHRMALGLPVRLREKVLYWKVADPDHIAAINPLSHDDDAEELTEYERLSRGRIQIELTSDIILAAVGEAGQGFGSRPLMRKWITRWLFMLWNAGLTLADARMLIDPQHHIYQLLAQLAPDEMSRHQLLALPGMKVTDLEAEIGSARNRLTTLLEHPAAEMLLSRRRNTIDFRSMYRSGTSLIIDLGKGKILTDEVQRLICNVVLTKYLAVVLSTPFEQRQRRLCIIDELPVFSDACGPLLERMCTEIRKFQTSFLFLHQGSARFEGRTENDFFQTINDMCRVKVLFRHNADAEWFGRQVALAAYNGLNVKYIQRTPQQFTVGHKIIELTDHGSGSSEMEGSTHTDGMTSSLTSTLARAVRAVDGADDITRTYSHATGSSVSSAAAKQSTYTVTKNKTRKQTLLPVVETRDIVSSVQFYSNEEVAWEGASMIKNLRTGEAIIIVDGSGVWLAQTPLAVDPYAHAPVFAAKRLAAWTKDMQSLPFFASPTVIMSERQLFLERLTTELERLAYSGAGHLMDPRQLQLDEHAATDRAVNTPSDPEVGL